MSDVRETAAVWARYAANAAILGGATIFLVVLLSSLDLDRRTMAALCFALAGSLLLCLFMRIQAGSDRWRPVQVQTGSFLLTSLFILAAFGFGVLMLTGAVQGRSPVDSFTSEWWGFASIALLSAIVGAVQRAQIETSL
jgi:hypothetical protein